MIVCAWCLGVIFVGVEACLELVYFCGFVICKCVCSGLVVSTYVALCGVVF